MTRAPVPPRTVVTPWGPSDRLREGRLRPGPQTSRTEVESSQRTRLFGAMVASVAERGYAATRLDDLVELSGVSTASFYRLFESKDACFLAASEALLRTALAETEVSGEGTWEERVRGALAAFARLVSAQPAAARMVLIDSFAAGPEATTAIDTAVLELQRRAVALARESPRHDGMPDEVAAAMIGAVQELARDRLRREHTGSLSHLMEAVADVALSYRPPVEPLTYTARLPRPREETVQVPGAAERAIRALAVVAAERGYRQVTVEEVVKVASMSPTTFYGAFADKGEAMLAAIDSAGAQMAASALPSFRRNADWPAALRIAFADLLAYLASRPALTRLVFVEAYAAGPEALQRREEALRPLRALLSPGVGRARAAHGAVGEVLWAAVVAMIQRQIRASGTESLPALGPILTFIVLGPYLGSEEASASAVAGRRDRRSQIKAVNSFFESDRADLVETTLGRRPSTPEELAEELGIELGEVHRLLTKMMEAGLAESLDGRGPDAPVGGRYRYVRDVLDVDDFRDGNIAEFQKLAGFIVGNLNRELGESLEAEIITLRPEFIVVRMPMSVDEEGWHRVSELLERTAHDVLGEIEKSRERLEQTGEAPIQATAALLHFEVPGRGGAEPGQPG